MAGKDGKERSFRNSGGLLLSEVKPFFAIDFCNWKVIRLHFKRLEDLRIDADKTQEEIAQLLNCKREVYRRYEKGIYEIPAWALIKLAQYYGTSTDYILGLSDKK